MKLLEKFKKNKAIQEYGYLLLFFTIVLAEGHWWYEVEFRFFRAILLLPIIGYLCVNALSLIPKKNLQIITYACILGYFTYTGISNTVNAITNQQLSVNAQLIDANHKEILSNTKRLYIDSVVHTHNGITEQQLLAGTPFILPYFYPHLAVTGGDPIVTKPVANDVIITTQQRQFQICRNKNTYSWEYNDIELVTCY